MVNNMKYNLEIRNGKFNEGKSWEIHLMGSNVYEYGKTLKETLMLVENVIKVDTAIKQGNINKMTQKQAKRHFISISSDEELDYIRQYEKVA